MNADVLRVQQAMKAEGFDPGPLDGVWGKDTQAAFDACLAAGRPVPEDEDPELEAELRRDEGERLKPYRCTAGKLSIGVGRNLDDVGITPAESAVLLRNDIARERSDLDRALPWWRNLDPVRRRVVQNMAFNLGLPKLLGFKNTLKFTQAGDYDRASANMLVSLWARQVGARAERLAYMMRTGKTP